MRINLDNIDSFVQTHWTGEFFYTALPDTVGVPVIDDDHPQWHEVGKLMETWEAEEHEDESYTVYRRPGAGM
jgi:hypothetical protein